MSEGYNGWSNYETWVVDLWMDNERSQQDYWLEEARQCLDETRESPWGNLTRSDMAAIHLADRIQGAHEDASTEMLCQSQCKTGPLADLLQGALDAVDWGEIARAWIEKMGELKAYEEEEV